MEDKRKLANDELKDMDGSFRFFAPPEMENFVELPKEESPESMSGPGSTVNNFNVAVNVQGNGKVNTSQINAAVQNALPTHTESPDQTKKNSSPISPDTLSTDSKQLPNLVSPEDEEYVLNEFSAEDIGPIPTLDMLGLNQFETPNVSYYTYSNSTLKENNPIVRREYEVLKNIVHHSSSTQEPMMISPASAIDQSMIVDYINSERVYHQLEKVQVQQNNQNSLNETAEMAKRHERLQAETRGETERQVNQASVNKEADALAESDNAEATSKVYAEGAGRGKNTKLSPPRSPRLNPTYDTIGMFYKKMNSPPSWRTALG